MAIALRGTAKTPTGNPTTGGTVTIDAAVVEGDWLEVHVTSRDAITPAVTCTDNDTGGNLWTLAAQSSDGKASLFVKRATSGTAGKTITISLAVGSCSFVHQAYSGVANMTTPYTDLGTETNASGDESHAGFTPDWADACLIGAVFNYANDNAVTSLAFATAGALTATEKLSTGGNDCGCIVGFRIMSGAPAATGNMTWAQTNGTTYSMVHALIPALSVTGVGAVATAEAFGTLKVNEKVQDAGAVSSLEAFGSHTLSQAGGAQSVTGVGAMASLETFGADSIEFTLLAVGGITSAEAFGAASLDFTVVGAGAIGTAEGFGTLLLGHRLPGIGAITTAEAFGTTSVDLEVSFAGVATLEAFGSHIVQTTALTVSGAGAIGSAEAFGAPSLALALHLSGVGSLEAFGAPSLDLTLRPAGIGSGETFGVPEVQLAVHLSGVASVEAFGTPTMVSDLLVFPISVPSEEAFGGTSVDIHIHNVGGISQQVTLVQQAGSLRAVRRTPLAPAARRIAQLAPPRAQAALAAQVQHAALLGHDEQEDGVLPDNVVLDYSGRQNHGYLIGSPAYIVSPWGVAFDDAINFDGVDLDSGSQGLVGLPLPNVGVSDFTFEFGFRRNNLSVGVIAGWWSWGTNGNDYRGLLVYVSTDAPLRCDFYNGGSGAVLQMVGGTTVVGTAHRCAIERSGTTVRVYLDGTVVATGTLSNANWAQSPLLQPTIARVQDGRVPVNALDPFAFDGAVEEVRLSNVARYSGAYTPAVAPFVSDANTLLLWHMERP